MNIYVPHLEFSLLALFVVFFKILLPSFSSPFPSLPYSFPHFWILSLLLFSSILLPFPLPSPSLFILLSLLPCSLSLPFIHPLLSSTSWRDLCARDYKAEWQGRRSGWQTGEEEEMGKEMSSWGISVLSDQGSRVVRAGVREEATMCLAAKDWDSEGGPWGFVSVASDQGGKWEVNTERYPWRRPLTA